MTAPPLCAGIAQALRIIIEPATATHSFAEGRSMAQFPYPQLGRYRLIDIIGRGGMGDVFLAHDLSLDRRVALKVLHPHLASDTVARERLRREALAAAALDHPFICKVFEVGEDAGSLFIAMEYIRGETLLARMRAGRIPLPEALRIAGEMADAIEEAHAANFVHRDLKPANIMLTTQSRVKIMDFGLAKKTEANGLSKTVAILEPLTTSGTIVGTPDYMSPEQITGAPVDGRSDQFAFGILLSELLIGKHPFQRSSAWETMAAILRDPPDLSLSGSFELPPGLPVLIRRLLAKSAEDRYISMAEIRADLARLAVASASEPHFAAPSALALIGRDTEREQILHHLDSALAGRGSFVLLGGEPGIGKTHLARTVMAEAAQRGCFGLIGHCYEMEGAAPYVPFVETLEYFARVAPPESFRRTIGESASEIARLMPELRRIYPDIPPALELPPEQQRRYLFNAYREFMERAARLTPVILIFEDLHWADEAALLLLGHLAQSVSTIPVLIIGTYREVDLDVTGPFARALASWIREKLALRVVLKPFGFPSVQKMLAVLSGKKPPDSLANVVFAQTEGNPFFVEEVFQHLNEEGKLFDETGAWRADLRSGELEVPRGVRLVISRRLERLREDTRRILTIAAVAGRSFELRLLEALDPAHPDAPLDALEEAERAQLVEPDRSGRQIRYRFVHELVRQTLAEALSLPRRQRLHARIADALERSYRDGQVSVIAHHLYQAAASADLDKTIEYLIRATRLASTGTAYEEALANTDKALSLIEGNQHPRIADLSLARAVALRSLYRWSEAKDWYERAAAIFVQTANIAGAVEASTSLAYLFAWDADGRSARPVLDRVLHMLGTEPSPLLYRLLLMQSYNFCLSNDMEAAFATYNQAKHVEAALPDPHRDGISLLVEGRFLFATAQIEQSSLCGRKAIEFLQASGSRWEQAGVYDPVTGAISLGRVKEAEPMLREMVPLAERVGHVPALWAYKFLESAMWMSLGDLDEAHCRATESHALAKSIGLVWEYLDYFAQGMIAYNQGQLDEAEKNIRHGLTIEAPTYFTGVLSGALFLTLAAKGDPGAADALAQARPHLPIIGRPSFGSWSCLALVLEGLAFAGMRDQAAALDALAEHVAANGPMCFPGQPLFRACAGIAAAAARNWSRAEQHFQAAIHQADSTPYRTAQATARQWYAEMLLARGQTGDRDRARELLNEALLICKTIGMHWYAQRSEQKLSAFARGAKA